MNALLRGILAVAAFVALVAVLFTWVFPWVEQQFLTNPVLGA